MSHGTDFCLTSFIAGQYLQTAIQSASECSLLKLCIYESVTFMRRKGAKFWYWLRPVLPGRLVLLKHDTGKSEIRLSGWLMCDHVCLNTHTHTYLIPWVCSSPGYQNWPVLPHVTEVKLTCASVRMPQKYFTELQSSEGVQPLSTWSSEQTIVRA